MAAIVGLVILVLGLTSSGGGGSGAGSTGQTALTVQRLARGRPIPAGFLGLSMEYSSVEAYAGTDPLALNPVLEQLIRNLTPGQAPVLRIGGDSTDRTWWPFPGTGRPPGVTFSLSPGWLQVTRALTAALNAQLILGLNLEAGNPQVAAVEARELIGGLPSGAVRALELGNEPELYGGFPWYRTADGRGIPGRSRSYGYAALARDFARVAAALPRISLAGPTLGGPALFAELPQFLASEPRVGLVTLHRYPLQLCYVKPSSSRYPTIGHLLSDAASTGLADLFAPSASVAHARGLPLRVDELSTVSCGADPKISETFSSALWALDTLFEMARVGIDGVNIHTYPGAGYELFRFGRMNGAWRASVSPQYYGLLMFAEAAPAGARLLATSGGAGSGIKLWATQAPNGRIRVVLINKDTAHNRVVALRLPSAGKAATLERLTAPSPRAATGVRLAGQSFGSQTDTGLLQGRSGAVTAKPEQGRYLIRLPAASAALLVLAGR